MPEELGLLSPAIPFELALAMGYSPSLVLPSGATTSLAEGLLPRNFCAYLKLLTSTLVRENRWKAIIVPLEDESHRRFSEVLGEMFPGRVLTLELPLRRDEHGARWLVSQFRKLAGQLGRDLHPATLKEAMAMGNELRKALRKIKELWISSALDSLSFRDLVVKAFSSPQEAIKLLREARPRGSGNLNSRPGIMLAGGVMVKRALVELVEEEGFRVVAEDSELGDRLSLEEIPLGEELEENLLNLAWACLRKPPSPRDMDPAGRLQFYERLIGTRKVRGVIFSCYKFCDPLLTEYPFIAYHLKRRGIPCLLVEEEDEALSGQTITRVQAFLEMVRCR